MSFKQKSNSFLPYAQQWLGQEEIEAVKEVLRSGWLTQGPKVKEFEKALADYCSVKYALALSSGTAALHSAFFALGLQPGDEVIVSPLTFSATAAAVFYLGAKPVLADIDEVSLNIDPKEVVKKISQKTKAIAFTDFAGKPCEIDQLREIAKKRGLYLVEDAAHSLGSLYKGRKVGALADLTCLSFHPVKTITTGEGGAVLTNNQQWAEKIERFRQHGVVKMPEKGGWYYQVVDLGYNYRLSDIASALGLAQLKKIVQFIKRRREVVQTYNTAFEQFNQLILPQEPAYIKSAWHLYPLQFDLERIGKSRRQIYDYFHQLGVKVQVHYIPLHFHPLYQKRLGVQPGDFPKAEKYYSRCLSLPLFPKMTGEDIERVIKAVKKAVEFAKK